MPYTTPYRPDDPDFEAELVEQTDAVGKRGDTVVIVGGGVGVSTVKVSQTVGKAGAVTVYEPAAELIMPLKKTITEAEAPSEITVKQTLIEKDVEVKGTPSQANYLPASKLPTCDILQLDCEGAEVRILEELEIRPRAIVVETHGKYGAPKIAVEDALSNLGYEIVDIGSENPDAGIYMLTAKLTN